MTWVLHGWLLKWWCYTIMFISGDMFDTFLTQNCSKAKITQYNIVHALISFYHLIAYIINDWLLTSSYNSRFNKWIKSSLQVSDVFRNKCTEENPNIVFVTFLTMCCRWTIVSRNYYLILNQKLTSRIMYL